MQQFSKVFSDVGLEVLLSIKKGIYNTQKSASAVRSY